MSAKGTREAKQRKQLGEDMAKTLGPGCCGPIEGRVALIRQVSQGIVAAHMGLAAMYDSIARELKDPEEIKAIKSAAEKQRTLAEESSKVTIPDGISEKAISGALSAMTPKVAG